MKKRIVALIFLIYMIILFYGIVFKYPFSVMIDIVKLWSLDSVVDHIKLSNFIPFKTIIQDVLYNSETYYIKVVIYNILAFVPFGFLLPLLKKSFMNMKDIILLSITLSLAIELIQLVTGLGYFDIDDIILNTAGGIIGYSAFCIIYFINKKLKLI